MAYLDTIDDLEATTAVNFTDIASVEPTFFIDSLTRILLICAVTYEQRLEEKRICITFIVDSETVLATDADFTGKAAAEPPSALPYSWGKSLPLLSPALLTYTRAYIRRGGGRLHRVSVGWERPLLV